jgi:pyruvate/2-oxoglutarate/acetoin dehydrogenase E1 component
MSIPGLKLIAPATPYDVKGMLKAAIRDDDPVISFEDGSVWSLRSEVPEDDLVIPLGKRISSARGPT